MADKQRTILSEEPSTTGRLSSMAKSFRPKGLGFRVTLHKIKRSKKPDVSIQFEGRYRGSAKTKKTVRDGQFQKVDGSKSKKKPYMGVRIKF
jgi:hypothetical protein